MADTARSFLVVGGGGFLGRYIVEELVAAGHSGRIRIFDLRKTCAGASGVLLVGRVRFVPCLRTRKRKRDAACAVVSCSVRLLARLFGVFAVRLARRGPNRSAEALSVRGTAFIALCARCVAC